MHIIQYPIILKHGYCLFNCPDATDSESYGDPAYPSIRMKVIKHSGEQDILDLFDFMTSTGNLDFEEHWHETLRGEETLWKIIRVIITDRHIYLQFGSEHFCSEDTDYMSIDTASLRATLQFEVPNPYSAIEVELKERYGITVTETDGNKKRKFEIHSPIEKEDTDNFHTIITEYM